MPNSIYWRVQEAAKARRLAPRSRSLLPHIAVIAAVDVEGGFSKNGQIPWQFPSDLKWFKQQTTGHVVVIGRKTYEDINARRGDLAATEVLPGRTTFVVSSTLSQDKVANAIVVSSPAAVLNHPQVLDHPNRTVFYAGGEQIFNYGLMLAQQVYLTIINDTYDCDLHFPTSDVLSRFSVIDVVRPTDEPKLVFTTWGQKT